jgi:homoserine dehydrogenase
MRAELALIGFGNVARRFVRLLEEQRPWLSANCDLECRIVAIATRRHGLAFQTGGLDSLALASLIERGGTLHVDRASGEAPSAASGFDTIRLLAGTNAPLRVVVETTTLDIAGGQPAIDHVRAALASGAHVVTANKGPAAFAYRELQSQAERAGLSFLFEGAVMDGIPIFSLVRETLQAVDIVGFRGILNSTTNHILTALEDGDEFGPALARMQAEGIAEADASLDVDGWDAAAKAAALANVLMDAGITPHAVRRTGIGPHSAPLARAAKERGRRLRLVASARRGELPVVEPLELPPTDLLAGLRGTANALLLDTDLLGEIAICQLDGGLTHTAYALLSDLITVRRRFAAPTEARTDRTP